MESSTELLKKIREQDEQSEVKKSPENQSLHPQRIKRYLEANEIDAENFDERFNFSTAIEILQLKQTPGEVRLEHELVAAKAYLDKQELDGEALLSDYDADTFRAKIHKELMARDLLDQEKKILSAHSKYLLIRSLAYRRLQIQEKFAEVREDEKVEATGGLKEGFTKVVRDVKKNFAKMSTGEKAVAVGALVIGTIWLFSQSDNPKVQKIKDYAWKGLKIGGAAIGANYLYKMFTGKTAWTALNDYCENTAGAEGFWKESFKTDSERAEILQKSVLYMGDKDFLDLVSRYRKGSKTKKLHLPGVAESDLSPEEAYKAMEVFFKRYPMGTMVKKYKNWPKESRTWRSVVSNQMAEDSRLEFEGNVAEELYDNVRYGIKNGYNWLVADGFGVSAYLYKKAWGKEGTQAEVKEWVKEYFENVVGDEKGLKTYLDENFRRKSAKNYKEVIERGHFEKDKLVKFLEAPGDSMYVMSTVKIDNVAGNNKAIGDAMKLAQNQIAVFLRERFPDHKASIYKFMLVEGGACVVNDSTFRLFARMPLKGTAEYHALNAGTKTTEDLAKRKEVEMFEGEIKYSGLKGWEQERLRLRFLLDSTQTDELEKICEWFTRKYKALGVSIDTVYKAMFEDDDDRDRARRATSINQRLTKNAQLLEHEIEDKIVDIEKTAAAKAPKEMFDELIEQMRNSHGYKVRLSILGDPKAIEVTEYKPPNDTIEDLLEYYEDLCERYVKGKIAGA